jgi:hypothetical protein
MKRFYLYRHEDETGISGTGQVAEGVIFNNGWVAMMWLTEPGSFCWYSSIRDVEKIHGHSNKTEVVLIDTES